MRLSASVCTSVVAVLAVNSGVAADPATASRKVCIAHAGAARYAPDHTRAAYTRALEMGADYIEQDLQLTKDGVLICIHDATLEAATNVEEVFPTRHRKVERDGATLKVWPVVDFTLEEIRKLDVGSWFDPAFADQRVVTFQESLDLVQGKAGIYPELKISEYLDEATTGLDVAAEFHRVLVKNGLNTPEGQRKTPVFVQCFYPEVLQRLSQLSGDAYPLNQLVWTTQVDELLSADGIAKVATYADALGPTVEMLLEDRCRIDLAKRHGLKIHPWFLSKQLPKQFDSTKRYYEHLLYDVGFDGLFVDDPDMFPRRKVPQRAAD